MPIPKQLPVHYPPDADYANQSYEVPGTKRSGQTGHYRNSAFPLLTLDSPNAFHNTVEFFDSGLQRIPSPKHPMFGRRPVLSKNPLKRADYYEWIDWETVDFRRRYLGSGLRKLFSDGVAGGRELDVVGLYSGNSPEWQIADMGCQAYGFITVSLYDTLGRDTAEYIINHTEMTLCCLSSQHIPTLLKMAPKIPTLKALVSLNTLPTEEKKIFVVWGETVGIKVMDLEEVEQLGKENLKAITYPSTDAISTICYTSGTTGVPKGVVMTHGMVANAIYAHGHGMNDDTIPVSIGFLPLAHCYGRMCEYTVITRGGSIGYWSGDPLILLEDVQILKPNIFNAVPRVLNRVVQAGLAATKLPGVKGALFRRALQAKTDRFLATGELSHPLWDRLVFSKVKAALGGNVFLITSGSAPMSKNGINFLKVAFGTQFLEGRYGSTENFGTATRQWWADKNAAGTVGTAMPNAEIKLIDVPSMGYTSEDKPYPRGELCVRGDMCFKGYYKDEKSTKGAIDEEGWQHTGDVAHIDECGRFAIIDRVKNIMKLSQGEYVAVERVEALYSGAPGVLQIYVHGDSLQSYLIAVVVPDPVPFAELASKVWGKRVSPTDTEALDKAVKDEAVCEKFLRTLDNHGKSSGLQGFEMIKRIFMTNELMTIDNGCLTPTLKIKRKDTYQRFKAELDALYTLPEPSSSKPAKL